ncbi:phosphoribosyl 1,2-cyclic phosphate phosphodiesterase [Halomicrobium zhouii]|uniref:Phosphoribosyl 1,2-cyclic phosphate phosphodiesterase n=1 Tax=Halomicrobium zhouii TaxID=767519 RepID=A0A1I6M7Q7_9EURY|nr:MBL fold metallo-hydrolase [Halomicrobium zhouii]SFS11663.1 phosphoribosyl 1,2-cyclic phosphate phosphodiesterase [Halomicrobium zhouii]
MEVTLLGTGDTTGTPTPRCDCETCERAREEDVERTRFSVHVRNEQTDQSLLIDASPDFRRQFRREDVPLPDAAVITHVHFDHLDGLGNAYRLLDHLPVHAADEHDPNLGESVAEHVDSRYHYLDQVTVNPETPFERFEAAGFEVTLVPGVHPPLSTYGLRIDEPETGASLAISGDTSYAFPQESRDVLRGADLGIVEGIVHADLCEGHPAGGDHYDADGVPRTFGTKHMTLTGARALAEDLDVDNYRIVHTAHFVPASQAFADDVALDGERFEL